jgi:hypothetical protein
MDLAIDLSISTPTFDLVCQPENDLFQILLENQIPCTRFDSPEAWLEHGNATSILILADDDPNRLVQLPAEFFARAATNKLKVFVEFPAALPEIGFEPPQRITLERGVVQSEFFGAALAPLRIVMLPDGYFLPTRATAPHLVLAKVAGFDQAIYGLANTPSFPLVFEHPTRPFLVATTRLSHFISGRYAPTDAWKIIWQKILVWLAPNATIPELNWQPAVRPCFPAEGDLPKLAVKNALRQGSDWFFNAKLLIHPKWQPIYRDAPQKWKDCVGPAPEPDWPCGDGRLGVLEGFSSKIDPNGKQQLRWWLRNDCNGEVAGALALTGAVLRDARLLQTAENLGDFIYFKSIMSQGKRADSTHPAFGLIGWNDVQNFVPGIDGFGVFYGDDNARGILGSLAAAAVLNHEKWNERLLQCLLANLRTAGKLGFRRDRLDEQPLEKAGWEFYFNEEHTSYAPHYQAYLWATWLWAYARTGFELFLSRAKSAIRATMEVYPHEWRWTNGIQQERARMLLPLAWLVRLEDRPEHRAWLRQMAGDLLASQDQSGAIRESLGEAGHGRYRAPVSNEAYGTDEAPLIQRNGDPVCDLLYTTNFAFLGLHEAAAATGDLFYQNAADQLADFLCRIQVTSDRRPELNGAWFRAFDFQRWEFWASNADAGWGAWCTETGWTQGWILMVLALRESHQNFWELTGKIELKKYLDSNVQFMLPNLPR